jgi:hypothetical protein
LTDLKGGAYGVLREIRSEAIEASLKEEAKLQEHFVMACAEIFRSAGAVGDDFISDNTDAAAPLECLAYWKRRTKNRLPGIIRLFEAVISDGGQPVFATISLRTLSMSPTLFIPIPYLSARDNREMLLINAHDRDWVERLAGDRDLFEETVRTVSHALLNISGKYAQLARPQRALREIAAVYR